MFTQGDKTKLVQFYLSKIIFGADYSKSFSMCEQNNKTKTICQFVDLTKSPYKEKCCVHATRQIGLCLCFFGQEVLRLRSFRYQTTFFRVAWLYVASSYWISIMSPIRCIKLWRKYFSLKTSRIELSMPTFSCHFIPCFQFSLLEREIKLICAIKIFDNVQRHGHFVKIMLVEMQL